MVGYGDGHASYFKDDNGPVKVKVSTTGETNGFVESTVIGDNMKYPGPGGFPNDLPFAEINANAKPGADEAVFTYFGRR
jgi:hypothetical protein